MNRRNAIKAAIGGIAAACGLDSRGNLVDAIHVDPTPLREGMQGCHSAASPEDTESAEAQAAGTQAEQPSAWVQPQVERRIKGVAA